MTKQEILDRIQNVLYQNVDTESQDLDLLRHDLELDIINMKQEKPCYCKQAQDEVVRQFNEECG